MTETLLRCGTVLLPEDGSHTDNHFKPRFRGIVVVTLEVSKSAEYVTTTPNWPKLLVESVSRQILPRSPDFDQQCRGDRFSLS